MRNDFIVDYPDYTDLQNCIKNNFVIDYAEASFKTRIRWMRTRIWRMQRTRRIWRMRLTRRTRRIRRIQRSQRIWWIRRIQQIRQVAQAIFKWFLSFIYSATKGFYLLVDYPLSYTWLNGEPQISRKERYIPRYLQYGLLDDCVFQFFSVNVHHYI